MLAEHPSGAYILKIKNGIRPSQLNSQFPRHPYEDTTGTSSDHWRRTGWAFAGAIAAQSGR
jgi:hypothetical protein